MEQQETQGQGILQNAARTNTKPGASQSRSLCKNTSMTMQRNALLVSHSSEEDMSQTGLEENAP